MGNWVKIGTIISIITLIAIVLTATGSFEHPRFYIYGQYEDYNCPQFASLNGDFTVEVINTGSKEGKVCVDTMYDNSIESKEDKCWSLQLNDNEPHTYSFKVHEDILSQELNEITIPFIVKSYKFWIIPNNVICECDYYKESIDGSYEILGENCYKEY
ncbi:MAG: hypothetical protein ABIJ18_02795 [archaeon]